jgi:hypothetical protein
MIGCTASDDSAADNYNLCAVLHDILLLFFNRIKLLKKIETSTFREPHVGRGIRLKFTAVINIPFLFALFLSLTCQFTPQAMITSTPK